MAGHRCYQFGEFRLDSSGRVLTSKGRTVPLAPKLGGTLMVLIENAGNVVEKQELLRKVWAGEFVEEGSVARTISLLRNILERDGSGKSISSLFPSAVIGSLPKLGLPIQRKPGRTKSSCWRCCHSPT